MFTKLDRGILLSSIMAEDSDTFKVWIVLLAACDADGVAPVSSVYISSVAHLPLDTVKAAIARLEAPDPESRSMSDEGRRLRRVDGGYKLVNYEVYRARSLREAEAERKRLYRNSKASPPNPPSSDQEKKEVEGEGEASAPVRKCPDNTGTDKDGLLPIPKGLPFEIKDELVASRAAIRSSIRRPDLSCPGDIRQLIVAFNLRIQDLS